MDIETTLQSLTLEEKARLCSGISFNGTYEAHGKVPSINLVDGPAGVRRQGGNADMLGAFASNPATCFPSGSTLANSWDTELTYAVGAAIGEECRDQKVDVLLGPSVNIKRSPLCGRNFEYYAEDPLLAGKLAAGYVRGVQSKGVGACVKHFAANNQETNRFTVDAQIDERTLREIYLPNFEIAITEGRPWVVMGAYNRLNGEHCCQNAWLLTDVLRGQWGFKGVTVSDWSGVWDRVQAIEAGLDLQMPYCGDDYIHAVIQAVQSGTLDEATLDETVRRILTLVDQAVSGRASSSSCDYDSHHTLACTASMETAVLLRNRRHTLPLSPHTKIALIGALAQQARIQGGGSSNVNPTHSQTLVETLAATDLDVVAARGYRIKTNAVDHTMTDEALMAARDADVIVYAAGLPALAESEGFDRKNLDLPANQIALLEALKATGKPIIMLLFAGAPLAGDWLDLPDALLAMYCGGQGQSEAAAALITGTANPCGKLAETWPIKLSDTPCSLIYPRPDTDCYAEGVFVGYRYYDTKNMNVRFPFGYGLSYTTFSYGNMQVSNSEPTDDETIEVSVDVTNTGGSAGKEIVQCYVFPTHAAVPRPVKELKAFEKVSLQPGETHTVTFTLGKRAFAYWSELTDDWRAENGTYTIAVGGSSANLPVSATVTLTETNPPRPIFTPESTIRQISADPKGAQILAGLMKQAHPTPDENGKPDDAPTRSMHPQEPPTSCAKDDDTDDMPFDAMETSMDMPLAKVADWSNGALTRDNLDRILAALNS